MADLRYGGPESAVSGSLLQTMAFEPSLKSGVVFRLLYNWLNNAASECDDILSSLNPNS